MLEKMQNMQDVISDLSKSVINEEAESKEVSGPAGVQNETLQPTANTDAVEAMSQNVVSSLDAPASTKPSDSVNQTASPAPPAASASTASPGPTASPAPSTVPSQNPSTDSPVQSENSTEKPDSGDNTQNVRKRYEIQPGDTLAAISIRMYNTDKMVDKICEYNDIEDGDQIVAGDVLILP